MSDDVSIQQRESASEEPADHRHDQSHREEMPRVVFTRKRLLGTAIFVVSAVAFLYFVLPKLAGLNETWDRFKRGDGWWLAVAVVLEVGVFVSYISLFRAVF